MSNLDLMVNAEDTAIREGINKISYVIHALFPFFGLEKKAVDLYISEIEQSNLPAEIKYFSIVNLKHKAKQVKSLEDIEQIAIDNAKPGTDFTWSSNVSEEWLERYMDSAKFVTDSEVKVIWGKILSKEFEEPGLVSPNIINVLPAITSKYAILFGFICDMLVEITHEKGGKIIKLRNECVVPIQKDMDYFIDKGLSFYSLNELVSLGLIRIHLSRDYIIKCNDEKVSICYYGKKMIFNVEEKEEFPIGSVMLTDVGKIIRDVTERREQEGYYDQLKKYYSLKGFDFEQIEKN